MRKFSSYGPVDTKLHYYVPRQALVDQAYTQLVGENPNKGGHYITVWAPRQRGKSWVMQQTLQQLRKEDRFDTVMLNLEDLRDESDVNQIVRFIAQEIIKELGLEQAIPAVSTKGGLLGGALNLLSYLPIRVRPQLSSFFASASPSQFHQLFEKGTLKKPLILILDDFDTLSEEAIDALTGVFRNIYITRQYESDKATAERKYLLHGLALVGRRSLLGLNNSKVPYNIQRSFYIPNLTFAEVEQMFKWYERESGQQVEQAVIERVYDKTQGEPALVSWLAELLTETHNKHNPAITSRDFEIAYAAARVLPNANLEHIERCAAGEPYQPLVLDLFQTNRKRRFALDDSHINFLYMNGVVDQEVVTPAECYLRLSCPLIQTRLFLYFSRLLFEDMGQLHEPFEDLSDTITDKHLNIKNLMGLYERYLRQNREWLLKDARTTDLQILRLRSGHVFEAVYHFNLYMYLSIFLRRQGGRVYPEFPTGNGKACPDVGRISLIINYAGQKYGLEVKSYADDTGYKKAIKQAAGYGQQLQLSQIALVFFVEAIDEANRQKYEVTTVDAKTKVSVEAIFVTTSG